MLKTFMESTLQINYKTLFTLFVGFEFIQTNTINIAACRQRLQKESVNRLLIKLDGTPQISLRCFPPYVSFIYFFHITVLGSSFCLLSPEKFSKKTLFCHCLVNLLHCSILREMNHSWCYLVCLLKASLRFSYMIRLSLILVCGSRLLYASGLPFHILEIRFS